MKTRLVGLFGLITFIFVLLINGVGADINFVSTTSTQTVVQGTTATVSFELTETGTGAAIGITFNTSLTLTSGSDTIVSDAFVLNAISALNNTTSTAGMSLNFTVPSTQNRGTYTGTLTPLATYPGGGVINPLAITLTIDNPFEVQACISIGNPGELRVKDIDFTNRGLSHNKGLSYTKFGDDDEWFPLDEIEVDIEIENNGNDDVDDIEVEWGIYDTKKNRWIIELDDEKDFNLKDDDEKTLTISFQLEDDLDVDLDDLDDGKHYRFYVIATGDVDDGTTPAPKTCANAFDTAEIVIESDFVVLNNIEYPETVMCGETVQVSADVWNIGEDDQDDVSVDIVSRELGLDKTFLIGDIDGFDNDVLSFTFTVPNDAEEKFHTITFEVWDEDNDIYENDFDDDESEFFLPIKVEDCRGVFDGGEVSISASLQSGGQAGQDLVVRAAITNNEDELRTFTVNAAGFTQWASSYTVDRTSLVLGAGESADVLFVFDVNKDASGSQSFTIELVSDENQVTTQPVSVAIERRSGLFGLTGAVTSGNAYLWGIGILNIILVVIIIIVAVRVARR